MTIRTIVFDLDGTLVRTRAASWAVFQRTAREFRLPVDRAEDFFALFRDNFRVAIGRMCRDEATADAVWQHFLAGLRDNYEPNAVPGMVDVVKSLAPHCALAVMSGNSMPAIRRILEDLGVASCFAHVFAAESGPNKAELLTRLLHDPIYGDVRQCSAFYQELADTPPAADEVVLVTDTVGDVQEALSVGARAIGVAWGMHGAQALDAAGAEFVALWPQEISARLLPEVSRPDAGTCPIGGACALPRTAASTATPRPAPAVPVPTAAAPSPDVDAAREAGATRHARRTAGVAGRPAPVSPCRCGGACGRSDGGHRCGSSARPAPGLLAAIGRIAKGPP